MREYNRSLSGDEKIRKRSYANTRNNSILDTDREKEKNTWKIITVKEIILLNPLINCVEELENYCLNKCIFK